MCDFVCGTMSRAKILLHWSVIHYQMGILRMVLKCLFCSELPV